MNVKYNRKIFSELHNALNIFRTIFRDDKYVCSSIDESYEETLIYELESVPEQFDDLILKYLNFVKVVAGNVNFKKLAEELDKLNDDSIPHLEINSLYALEQGLDNLNLTKANRARVLNIVTKLKPMFACVDKVVSMPIQVLRRIGELTDNSYKDIL